MLRRNKVEVSGVSSRFWAIAEVEGSFQMVQSRFQGHKGVFGGRERCRRCYPLVVVTCGSLLICVRLLISVSITLSDTSYS
jgi:hypothetical protein